MTTRNEPVRLAKPLRSDAPAAEGEMRRSLVDLAVLYRAARRAVRRQRAVGRFGRATRLAAHARFLARLIAAIRLEVDPISPQR